MLSIILSRSFFFFFFFNDTATTEIYTLSHTTLFRSIPIAPPMELSVTASIRNCERMSQDRKSTRLNSSHTVISYAVFCLKKKKKKKNNNNNKTKEKQTHNNEIKQQYTT